MAKIIGIDLGTTNCCLAFIEGGKAQVIPTKEGSRTIPSVVGFTEKGDRLVGHIAKRQMITNPINTVYAVKRLLGRKFDSPEVKKAKELLPYEITGASNGDIRIKIHGKEFSPPEISGIILARIKEIAEGFVGSEIDEAIITVPAYFDDSQRQATKDAGRIAGLKVSRIINEPTAACLAYGHDETEEKRIAVYDLGGGTFDITILQIGDGVFEVKATSGDTFLGGEDFDNRIVEWLFDCFREQHGIELRHDKLALQRLKEAAEKAKCELSAQEVADINLPFLSADEAGPKHLNVKLERPVFEKMIEDLVERTRQPVMSALEMARLKPDEIDEVLLVGGQTRTPRVVELVREIFGREPNRDKNPDEVVGIGAAIQAGILRGEVKDMVLLDVTPLSLGIETRGGMFTKLIERSSTIPTRKSKIFTTVADNQTKVEVHVLQGERELAAHNKSLGRFDLVGIPQSPKGVPQIEVSFDIDSNGIVHVSARDQTTGSEQRIVVTPSSGLSEGEINDIIEDARRHAEEDRVKAELLRIQQRLEGLLDSNEKTFAEFGSLLEEAKRKSVQRTLADARRTLGGSSVSECTECLEKLQEVSKILTDVILYNPSAMSKVPGPGPAPAPAPEPATEGAGAGRSSDGEGTGSE
ncbi:MAG TPA: molecular chaperone DnaK [Candidatus Saccharimonadales bacterium]|nr:molecular chaperone DnaK [Candidatus Saccharimonadales bacterium]